MEHLRKATRRWWEGVYVPHDNPPGSGLVFVGGYQRRHWTARAARACWAYFQEHHRWPIGTVVAVVGITVAAMYR